VGELVALVHPGCVRRVQDDRVIVAARVTTGHGWPRKLLIKSSSVFSADTDSGNTAASAPAVAAAPHDGANIQQPRTVLVKKKLDFVGTSQRIYRHDNRSSVQHGRRKPSRTRDGWPT